MTTTELTTAITQHRTGSTDPSGVDHAFLADLRERLLRDAFLFEDPRIYEAGVEDALAGVEAVLRTPSHARRPDPAYRPGASPS